MIPKKSLGQHFIRCQWAIDAMVKAADLKKTDTVIEVGPGTGALTRALCRSTGKVVAVEKDEKLAHNLRRSFLGENITNASVVTGDILNVLKDENFIPQLGPSNYKIVANIPYYLTGRLFRLVFEGPVLPQTIVLTVQKEVARRISSRPPEMSMLAISIQAFGKPEIIKNVPADCFVPPPKVDSAVVRISDISFSFFEKNNLDKKNFFETVKRAFSQKRKILSNTLPELKKAKTPLSSARPQELSLTDWADVARMARQV